MGTGTASPPGVAAVAVHREAVDGPVERSTVGTPGASPSLGSGSAPGQVGGRQSTIGWSSPEFGAPVENRASGRVLRRLSAVAHPGFLGAALVRATYSDSGVGDYGAEFGGWSDRTPMVRPGSVIAARQVPGQVRPGPASAAAVASAGVGAADAADVAARSIHLRRSPSAAATHPAGPGAGARSSERPASAASSPRAAGGVGRVKGAGGPFSLRRAGTDPGPGGAGQWSPEPTDPAAGSSQWRRAPRPTLFRAVVPLLEATVRPSESLAVHRIPQGTSPAASGLRPNGRSVSDGTRPPSRFTTPSRGCTGECRRGGPDPGIGGPGPDGDTEQCGRAGAVDVGYGRPSGDHVGRGPVRTDHLTGWPADGGPGFAGPAPVLLRCRAGNGEPVGDSQGPTPTRSVRQVTGADARRRAGRLRSVRLQDADRTARAGRRPDNPTGHRATQHRPRRDRQELQSGRPDPGHTVRPGQVRIDGPAQRAAHGADTGGGSAHCTYQT